jgi:hypothetical protein
MSCGRPGFTNSAGSKNLEGTDPVEFQKIWQNSAEFSKI